MRTVNSARDALKKPRKASTKPQRKTSVPAPGVTPSEQDSPTSAKLVNSVSSFEKARNAVWKNVSFALSPEVSIPVLDKRPIAVPAPAVQPAHENISKVLPETAFRGNVDTRQTAPDKDLREAPAGKTEPQMSESKAIERAKREIVRRAGKKAKTHGLAAAATKTTRRRGVALSKQPGYQVPIRRNNAPVALLINRQTYSKMKRISEISGVSMNKIFGELAAAFVARYETSPITVSPHDAIQMDHEAKLQAVRQLAYAIQIAVK